MTLLDPIQLARQHHAARRFPEAEATYRQLLASDPQNADALHGLGWLAHQLGNHQAAIQLLEQALESHETDYVLHWHIATVNERLGRIDRADAAYARACELMPKDRELLNRWGVFLASNRLGERALEIFHRVVKLDPNFAAGFRNIGLISDQLHRFPEAEAAFRTSVDLEPGSADAWSALGRTIGRAGRVEESVEYFQRAIAISPYHFDANFNLAVAFRKLRRFEGAIAPLERAMTSRPGSDVVLKAMASNLADLGRHRDALPLFDTALAMAPHDPEMHDQRAFSLLATGNLPEGFREYEWRWKTAGFPHNRRYTYVPQWTGSDIAGKTILLHAEQGYGDAIQFIRYAPLVAQRGARVLLQANANILALLRTADGISHAISDEQSPGKFDMQCPLMSLPLAFGTTLATIPGTSPYLHADPARIEQWKPRLEAPPGVRRIGLAWAGRGRHWRDGERSMPVEMLAPLAAVGNVKFFSLQKGRTAADRVEGLDMVHLGADLKTFVDTAAVLMQLDLLITVDTAVAHLAGALGKPVWNLLGGYTDFRWMLDREDTPWYPTMRLFRQAPRGDWTGTIERVVQALTSGEKE